MELEGCELNQSEVDIWAESTESCILAQKEDHSSTPPEHHTVEYIIPDFIHNSSSHRERGGGAGFMLNTGLCLSDPLSRLSQLMQDPRAGNKHARPSSFKEC